MTKFIKNNKSFGFGVVGIIIIIAAIAILGGFFGYQYLKLPNIQERARAPVVEPPVTPSAQIQPQTNEIHTSNWKTYRNEEYGFEVRYPEAWVVIKDAQAHYFSFLTYEGREAELWLPTKLPDPQKDPQLEKYKRDWLGNHPHPTTTQFREITFGDNVVGVEIAWIDHEDTLCKGRILCTGYIYYYAYKSGSGGLSGSLELKFKEDRLDQDLYKIAERELVLVHKVLSTFKFIPLKK